MIVRRLFVTYWLLVAFFLGIAVARINDSARVARVVAEYTALAEQLRERLMEIEKPE